MISTMIRKLPSPAALVVIGVLMLSVISSLGAVGIAVLHGDRTLPEQFHWEGWQVDRDFSRSQRAADRDVRATVEALPTASVCRVSLMMEGAPPAAITLAIVHASQPSLDQHLTMQRTGAGYEAACRPVSAGQWLLEITDDANTWSVRKRLSGQLDSAVVAARPESE
jgi:hypothetical protein